MHTWYNYSNKGHLSHACLKPWKQRIQSADLAKGDIKSIIAEAVTAALDARELANKSEQVKELEKANKDFQAGQW